MKLVFVSLDNDLEREPHWGRHERDFGTKMFRYMPSAFVGKLCVDPKAGDNNQSELLVLIEGGRRVEDC